MNKPETIKPEVDSEVKIFTHGSRICNKMAFYSKIKPLCLAKNITFAQLAKYTGIPEKTIISYDEERDVIKLAPLEDLEKIAMILGCNPKDLYGKYFKNNLLCDNDKKKIDSFCEIVKADVSKKINVIIEGGPATGKTSLLNAFLMDATRDVKILIVKRCDITEIKPTNSSQKMSFSHQDIINKINNDPWDCIVIDDIDMFGDGYVSVLVEILLAAASYDIPVVCSLHNEQKYFSKQEILKDILHKRAVDLLDLKH